MSIADKLVTVAENQQKVFDAGGLHYSPKGTASGEVVSISDVAPVEHNMAVKLSSDTITDFSTVKLDALGKNIIPYSKYSKIPEGSSGVTFTDNGDGTVTVSGKPTTNTSFNILSAVVLPKGTYFLSGLPSNITASMAYISFRNNKTQQTYPTSSAGSVITLDEDTSCNMGVILTTQWDGTPFTIKPQLEVGTSATEYEPYKEPITYTPSADGTVANVKSIYPTTTLMTDTSGVLLQCEYYQDARKVKQDLTDLIISLGGEI